MVRLFNFKNNFLSDKIQSVSAPYSVFGYYDGLSMQTYEDEKSVLQIFTDPLISEFTGKETLEMCDYYSIVGICQDSSDKDFWKMDGKPYIFVSCLRSLKRMGELTPFIQQLKAEQDAVFYTTVDSSDLVICIRTSTYEEGYRTIESYPNMLSNSGNKLQKGYSVCLIFQPVLDILAEDNEAIREWGEENIRYAQKEIEQMREEKLDCSIRCVVKDWMSFPHFVNELRRLCEAEPQEFGVLGSEDVILRLSSVDSRKVLALFGRNNILTHGNKFYSTALYNARTEILVQRVQTRADSLTQDTLESKEMNNDSEKSKPGKEKAD